MVPPAPANRPWTRPPFPSQTQLASREQCLAHLRQDFAQREESLEAVNASLRQRLRQALALPTPGPTAAAPAPATEVRAPESIMAKFQRVHFEVISATLQTEREKAQLLALRRELEVNTP